MSLLFQFCSIFKMITFLKKKKNTPDVAAYLACCSFQREFTSSVMRANHATSIKLVILKIAAQWNHQGSFYNEWCLGHPPRDSEVIGAECSFLGHGIFKSSPSDSNVQLRLKITALINRIIMNCLITEKTTQIKPWL